MAVSESESDASSSTTVALAAAVHDVRNRMFQVQARLHKLIQGRGQDTELCDRISAIEQEFSRLSGDLGQVLHKLRLSGERISIHLEQHALGEFLEQALEALPEPGLPLEVVVDPKGLSGYFDGPLMAGVIRDAVDNACRYGRSKCRIRASAMDGGVLLEVEDDGEGFSGGQDPQARTGLGMLIARRVAEAHESNDRAGRIEVGRSQQLGGASLRIWLP